MRPSPRIEKLLSLFRPGAFLADVGSDHGQLVIGAVDSSLFPRAMAIENKKGPYARLKAAVEESGHGREIVVSLSDGLDELDPSCDSLALCGMGGRLIAEILERGKAKLGPIKQIVVDAHSERPYLDERLLALGFVPSSAVYFEERGKGYSLERWERGELGRPLSSLERKYGLAPFAFLQNGYRAFLERERDKSSLLSENGGLPPEKRTEEKESAAELERYLHENA